MLRKSIYPKIEALLTEAASFFREQGFSPNQLTLAGLALNFVAGWIYASGHLFLGAVMLLVAAVADLLDGPLARLTGKVSKFGAFLDSTVDRYSDFFLFGGLAIYFAGQGRTVLFVVTMGIILGAYVTSYSKARAENLIPDCSVGVFERPERLIALAFGSIFQPLLGLVLWILLIGTHATAIQRILHTKKSLSSPPPENQA